MRWWTTCTLAPDASSGSCPRWHFGDFDDKDFDVNARTVLAIMLAISLAITTLLLVLYIRWVRRYRNVAPAPAGDATATAGLGQEAIDHLPVKMHVPPPSGEEVQCSICLSTLEEGDKVKVLPGCEHGFHPECVGQWLSKRPTCPLCRASLGGYVEVESPAALAGEDAATAV